MAKKTKSTYQKSVFINCPFDPQYRALFRAAIFTIMECGFTPRCTLEVSNAAQIRIDKINELIRLCKFGVHDISRTELDRNKLPRFNMPFELGLFLGCKNFGDRTHMNKVCIIFDRKPYRFQKFLSDIAGQDIVSHDKRAEIMIGRIRDWLNTHNGKMLPSSTQIIKRYNQFRKFSLPGICKKTGHKICRATIKMGR